jgi:hypothetical protein
MNNTVEQVAAGVLVFGSIVSASRQSVTVAIWRHGIALNYAAVAFAPAGVGLPEAELERLRRPLPPGNAVARDERPRSFRV